MSHGQLYKKFATYYDKIYENVDYEGESEFINWAVKKHKTSPGIDIIGYCMWNRIPCFDS